MMIRAHVRGVAEVDIGFFPLCQSPDPRVFLLEPLLHQCLIPLQRTMQRFLAGDAELRQQPSDRHQAQRDVEFIFDQRRYHLACPQSKRKLELQWVLLRHRIVNPLQFPAVKLRRTPEQRLGFQRSPTTTSILCQPPVNRRTIDANNTSDEFRTFTVLDTAHRTLTHRLQRRVIQSPCIVPSHARRESYSPRPVKHEVYLLMYRLIKPHLFDGERSPNTAPPLVGGRMSLAYNHKSIEPKWQARWRAGGVHLTGRDPHRPKFYVLDMFPYPSGSGLHIGHCEGYTASDVVTRWKRMQGFNVLHPFGWDAFGLPAENYAIKTGVHPRITTAQAVANFRRQLDLIGFAYDWEREINTTDPEYVRWTQWLFLQLFKAGLAYEGTAPINWCPSCKTGLANEEVLHGRCERCDTPVERKNMRQWLLRITRYADRLLDDLAEVDWPESTITMQRNWIGRSQGAEVVFAVADEAGRATGDDIPVFTTRPDTLFGATYLVLAPEHDLVAKLTTAARRELVEAYALAAQRKSDLDRTDLAKEKTGTFTGAYAINPVNGERIPIWIAR